MSNEDHIILKAQYHPILKKYLFLYVLGILFLTIAGIVLVPFWLLVGYYFCAKYFNNLECDLNKQTLVLKKGYLFKVEKTIPLDKIQDLTLREGPLLRAFNICMLEIETAGQSNPQGRSDAKIIGLVDAKNFRDHVLSQRDLTITLEKSPKINVESPAGETSMSNIFVEIRDTLYRVEKLLGNKN